MKVLKTKKVVTSNIRSLSSDIVIEKPDGDVVCGSQVLVRADSSCERIEDRTLSDENSLQSLNEGVVCPFPRQLSATVATTLAAGIGHAAKVQQETINQKFREDLQRQVDSIKKQFANALPTEVVPKNRTV